MELVWQRPSGWTGVLFGFAGGRFGSPRGLLRVFDFFPVLSPVGRVLGFCGSLKGVESGKSRTGRGNGTFRDPIN